MKKYIKKLLIINLIFILTIVSFEPWITKADAIIDIIDDPLVIYSDGTDSFGDKKTPGLIYNNQKSYNIADPLEPGDGFGAMSTYTYGNQGTVYARRNGYSGPFGENAGDVQIKKTVSMVDGQPGVYEVNFQARAVDYKPVQTYIVIVFDISNSMNSGSKLTNAKNGVRNLGQSLLALNGDTKTVHVGLIQFGGQVFARDFSGTGYTDRKFTENRNDRNNLISETNTGSFSNYSRVTYPNLNFETNYANYFTESLSDFPNNMTFHGVNQGTNTQAALDAADQLLRSVPVPTGEKVNKMVVLISDGEPTVYYSKQDNNNTIYTCDDGYTYNDQNNLCEKEVTKRTCKEEKLLCSQDYSENTNAGNDETKACVKYSCTTGTLEGSTCTGITLTFNSQNNRTFTKEGYGSCEVPNQSSYTQTCNFGINTQTCTGTRGGYVWNNYNLTCPNVTINANASYAAKTCDESDMEEVTSTETKTPISYSANIYTRTKDGTHSSTQNAFTSNTDFSSDITKSYYAAKYYSDMIQSRGIPIYTIGYEVSTSNDKYVNGTRRSQDWLLNDLASPGKYLRGNTSTIEQRIQELSAEIKSIISQQVSDGLGIHFEPSGSGDFTGGSGSYKSIVSSAIDLNSKKVKYSDGVERYQWNDLGKFRIYIDPDSPTGWYDTNDDFEFTFSNELGEKETIKCTDNPKVWWVQKTHEYTIKYFYDDGSGYKQLDASPDEHEDGILLEIKNGVVTNLFGPESNVNGAERTINYEYELVDVRRQTKDHYKISEGSKVTSNDYKELMSKNDDENYICIYYKKAKNLVLQKIVKDLSSNEEIKDDTKEFRFKIEFSYKPSNGIVYKYNGQNVNFVFEKNQKYGYVSLKGGESIAFVNLPSGIKYTITEENSDGYMVSIQKDGTDVDSITNQEFKNTSNSKIVFTNMFGYELPEAGSHGGLIMTITSIFLIGTPVIYIAYNFYIDSKRRISWRFH